MTALTVLSLGAGVQSTTLGLLMVDGHLPRPDVAIFADTGWEPAAVYEHLERLAPVLESAGIEVARVAAGNLRADALASDKRFASMPLYILHADGSHGFGRRQCTKEYKLGPILAEVRRRLGAPVDDAGQVGRVRGGRRAEVSIGISSDEAGRARDSRVGYAINRHPLLTAFDRPWTRAACRAYLAERWPWPVPRSACVGCPYRTDSSWLELTEAELADAVEFDHEQRAAMAARGFRGTTFLHRRRIPLGEVEFDQRDRPPAPTLFDEPSCSPWGCERGPQ